MLANTGKSFVLFRVTVSILSVNFIGEENRTWDHPIVCEAISLFCFFFCSQNEFGFAVKPFQKVPNAIGLLSELFPILAYG